MSSTVIFRTPGKLDLRAITVFGMNAKPNTQNPIGFFGTGLKYAIANLARREIPVTIYVGKQKWTLQVEVTDFRKKSFKELFLLRHGAFGIKKTIRLPFTTELGKTWELWQVFRELYANTLDEQGITYHQDIDHGLIDDLGHGTFILVESGEFVQEYLERKKTFLPDALRQQANDAPVQHFERSSMHVYWRGMRIYDLREPSMYTWNILRSIELTEDRTAKYPHQIDHAIEDYVRQHAPKEVIRKVITAPIDSFERRLTYDYHYSAPSEDFLEEVKGAPKDEVAEGAKRHAASFMPPEPKEEKEPLSKDELVSRIIGAINGGSWDTVEELIDQDRQFIIECLRLGLSLYIGTPPASPKVAVDMNDEIPF